MKEKGGFVVTKNPLIEGFLDIRKAQTIFKVWAFLFVEI